jgi:tetratricopeptide (TPR) repeat protein
MRIRYYQLIISWAVFIDLIYPFILKADCGEISPDSRGDGRWSIRDIINVPEEQVDIGLWSLVIAREFDSTIDVVKYLNRLEQMKAEIWRMAAGQNTDMAKFIMTRMFLYEPGIWNNNRPFTYDLDDPMGDNLENQLISSYLETRKGNCVSMPTLFLALIERVDPNLDIVGVRAPSHLFCRFHDRQTGETWNVETTCSANPADDSLYIARLDIPKVSIERGAYLRDLGKKEYVAELLHSLISKYRRAGDYQEALKYAELLLRLNPNSISGLVHKGAILSWMSYRMAENAGAGRIIVTPQEKTKLRVWRRESVRCMERARSLGWRPESPQQRREYLEMVERAKENR